MSEQTTTILLAGVGGQGTILAADLLARVAIASGIDVKISEIHGMSQRGGAVTTVVRFGEKVTSMMADKGCADYLVSFETTEAMRNIEFLREGGFCLVNDIAIKSMPVLTGAASMPEDAHAFLSAVDAQFIPADVLAKKAGTAKAGNVVLLGALSRKLPFDEETWKSVIAKRVPEKFIDANLRAFELGRAFVE